MEMGMGMERVRPGRPQPRAARHGSWLRSTLEHLHRPQPGVDNEIVVLATGIDQYLQEVFHHLARPSREDTVSAEDFTALCSVLGLEADGQRRTPGDEEEEEEQLVCRGLPGELSFKDFHSRLCGFFRVRNDLDRNSVKRLNFSQETELVEREIRLRWPRVRRRKCVSFDLSADRTRGLSKDTKDKVHTRDHDPGVEAAALRELVEDLRAALQSSDARCVSLEVALRRHSGAPNHSALSPSTRPSGSYPADPGRDSGSRDSGSRDSGSRDSGSRDSGSSLRRSDDRRSGGKWTDRAERRGEGDPLLRELRLIRASRDGQVEEAIRFNRRLEEELGWAYQEAGRRAAVESALRKENTVIRRRAEEAREAVKQGLHSVRLIQEQAQSVPGLQNNISQLETELRHYRYRHTVPTDLHLRHLRPTPPSPHTYTSVTSHLHLRHLRPTPPSPQTYTSVTSDLHLRHLTPTPPSPQTYTSVTSHLHLRHLRPTPPSPHTYTSVTSDLHLRHLTPTPPSPQTYTSVTSHLHLRHLRPTPPSPHTYTSVTSHLHLRHLTPTPPSPQTYTSVTSDLHLRHLTPTPPSPHSYTFPITRPIPPSPQTYTSVTSHLHLPNHHTFTSVTSHRHQTYTSVTSTNTASVTRPTPPSPQTYTSVTSTYTSSVTSHLHHHQTYTSVTSHIHLRHLTPTPPSPRPTPPPSPRPIPPPSPDLHLRHLTPTPPSPRPTPPSPDLYFLRHLRPTPPPSPPPTLPPSPQTYTSVTLGDVILVLETDSLF
ncbi:hypothetical protein NHX12_030713 [Muraenolepis orangiensis]|uniref:Uncharacterized protein n=1 Tax=Muraenolepis orangiensis TaxID=630683 RepID=A0A9Q0EAE1_9TELE|nr:hypothetical protein NHX12_030713 [Muraenolepis orangiensis]